MNYETKPELNCKTFEMILLDPGLGGSSFKGKRWDSMAKASLRDVNGLGGHGRDLDLALYFTDGPRRL